MTHLSCASSVKNNKFHCYKICSYSRVKSTHCKTLVEYSMFHILNSFRADDENRGTSDIYKAPINVFPNGTAIWYVPVVWKSSCMVDITWFPVDTQVSACLISNNSSRSVLHRMPLRFTITQNDSYISQQ